jgi:hypothetical protein
MNLQRTLVIPINQILVSVLSALVSMPAPIDQTPPWACGR